ncbi:MAG: T9SS type A sorting domain-containing protein [Bacteroidia bacterium]
MMKKLLLILLLVTCTILQAQVLAPHETATLRAHMLEVNAEWSHMAPEADWLDHEITFPNEQARIQTHLNLVIKTLRGADVKAFSKHAITTRGQLLNELQGYATEGHFPKNINHSYRIPYFIDHEGTACAVGYMMIQSGAGEVARRVQSEMNQAYLREIPYKEVPVWAENHGFSLNELAWIQPGYPPQTNYANLGNGVDGVIYDIAIDPADGSYVMIGDFTEASGVTSGPVVRWRNNAYEAIGSLLSGMPSTVAFHQGKLYVGGKDFGTNNNIAIWDGQTWALGKVGSGQEEVRALLPYQGDMHAATSSGLIAYEKVSSWIQVGSSLGAAINTLEIYNNELLAAGELLTLAGNRGDYAVRFDQSKNDWEPLSGAPLDGIIHDLHIHKGELYAAGELYRDNTHKTKGISKLVSASWETVLDTINDFGATFAYRWSPLNLPTPPRILSMATHQGGLFIGGRLKVSTGGVGQFGGGMLWLRETDSVSYLMPVLGMETQTVHTLANSGTGIILGGNFLYRNQTTGNVFVTDLTGLQGFVSNDPGLPKLNLQIGPNPWIHETHVSGLPDGSYSIRLLDVQGKEMQLRYDLAPGKATLYRDNLTSGMYFLNIIQKGRSVGAAKLVIQ